MRWAVINSGCRERIRRIEKSASPALGRSDLHRIGWTRQGIRIIGMMGNETIKDAIDGWKDEVQVNVEVT